MRFVYCLRVSNPNTRRPKAWPQCLAVITASICAMSVGMHFAWTSPGIPIILSDQFPVNITSEESSYITAVAPLGNLVGVPLAGWLAGILGRKYVILLSALPTFMAWMVIAFANSPLMFYSARILSGAAEGIVTLILPMYIGEITEPKVRGALCNIAVIFLSFGMLLVSTYTPFLSIRDSSLISAIVPLSLIVCFSWMPESPYYFIIKRNEEKAKKSLYFLRRCDIENDFVVLKNDVERQMSENRSFKDLFCIKSNRKALFIAGGSRVIQQLSGTSARLLYIQTIFARSGANLSPVLSSCIYLLVQLTVSCGTSVLLHKYGKRFLLIVSCVVSGILLTVLGVYFYLQEMTDTDISLFTWVPIVVMTAIVIFFTIGIATIPSVMMGELFSTSVKGKALCVLCIFNALLMSASSKLFHYMTEKYGMYSSFFLFAIVCFMGVVFSFFVPETRGKTLEEIQQNLKGNNIHLKKVQM